MQIRFALMTRVELKATGRTGTLASVPPRKPIKPSPTSVLNLDVRGLASHHVDDIHVPP